MWKVLLPNSTIYLSQALMSSLQCTIHEYSLRGVKTSFFRILNQFYSTSNTQDYSKTLYTFAKQTMIAAQQVIYKRWEFSALQPGPRCVCAPLQLNCTCPLSSQMFDMARNDKELALQQTATTELKSLIFYIKPRVQNMNAFES